MAAGNGNRAPRIQLGADQQGAAPFATRNGLDGVGWLLFEKLVTIHTPCSTAPACASLISATRVR